MSSHSLCLLLAVILLPVVDALGGIGVFEFAEDIGGPNDGGSTAFQGTVDRNGALVEQYEIVGCGSGIGGHCDEFHFAYRTLSGQWRLSAEFEWSDQTPGDGAMQGVMIRASNADDTVQYGTLLSVSARGDNQTEFLIRDKIGSDTWDRSVGDAAGRLGIQRVLIGGEIPAVESIADFGSGWKRLGDLMLMTDLAETAAFGVAVASGSARSAVSSLVTEVVYERAAMVGPAPEVARIPAGAAKPAGPRDRPGFVMHTATGGLPEEWAYADMCELLDLRNDLHLSTAGLQATLREVPLVNFYDSGHRGTFACDNGFPDGAFPGVDAFECPAGHPAGGDDDDNFAAEVTALIHLTPGLHVMGVRSEGATVIAIGGVEIGRTDDDAGLSNRDFIFDVERAGDYTFRARYLVGQGAAALELHEIVKRAEGQWRRVLLGDVNNGGSAVYVPQPATIVLLGLGGLALLRGRP